MPDQIHRHSHRLLREIPRRVLRRRLSLRPTGELDQFLVPVRLSLQPLLFSFSFFVQKQNRLFRGWWKEEGGQFSSPAARLLSMALPVTPNYVCKKKKKILTLYLD